MQTEQLLCWSGMTDALHRAYNMWFKRRKRTTDLAIFFFIDYQYLLNSKTVFVSILRATCLKKHGNILLYKHYQLSIVIYFVFIMNNDL